MGGEDSRKLVPLGALDDIVQYQDGAVRGRLEDEHVLVLALLVVQDLIHLQGHRLAGPHGGDLAEPAICREGFVSIDGRCTSRDR